MVNCKLQNVHSERGAALLIALAFLILIAWAAFLYGFNTLVSDSDVVQLDALCQTISKSALNEFPHPLGGFKSLSEQPLINPDHITYVTDTPQLDANTYEMLFNDINKRIQSTFALMGYKPFGQPKMPAFGFWEYFENPAAHNVDFWGGVDEGQIAYTFAPINTRCYPGSTTCNRNNPDTGQWNNGIKIRLAKLHNPYGTILKKPIDLVNPVRTDIAQVECEAVIRPIDVLLVEDTSAAQSRWTKAGDGGDLQRLCTEDGKRYEDHARDAAGNQQVVRLGFGGPIRNPGTGNVDVYSLCWRVCVADGNGNPIVDGAYPNDFMILAGPAGKQAWECPAGSASAATYGPIYGDTAGENGTHPADCVKQIAVAKPVPSGGSPDAYTYPYLGQRVVCQTAHSNPGSPDEFLADGITRNPNYPPKSHIMLTSAAEGQSKYCAPDPKDGSNGAEKYGYHPICWDPTTFMRGCADSATWSGVACNAATSPTGAKNVVPAAKDMLVTERRVIDYIINGLSAVDDPNLTGGPNNARWAVATLGGNEDLPSGAIALEYQADQLYLQPGAQDSAQVRLRHYYAYTNFLNALNSMMDARQCVNDYMLKLKLSTLAGVNFIEGGDSRCDLKTDGTPNDFCYQTEWKPSGSPTGAFPSVGQNWSSSLYRYAVMHYGDIASFSNGDPRFANHQLFEPIMSHSQKYMRPLDEGAMTRPVVQQNGGYGCEAWFRYYADQQLAGQIDGKMWNVTVKPDSAKFDIATPLKGGVRLPFAVTTDNPGTPNKQFASGYNRQFASEAPTPKVSLVSPQDVLKYSATGNIVTVYSPTTATGPTNPTDPALATMRGALNPDFQVVDSTATPTTPRDILRTINSLAQGGICPQDPSTSTSDPATWSTLCRLMYKTPTSTYTAPVPGFFRVGPPVDPHEPTSFNPNNYDFNENVKSSEIAYAKNKTNFILGWNASGRRHSLSALALAADALEKAPPRPDAVLMGPTSLPEKLLVFNASGPPSDLECLKRQLSKTGQPLVFVNPTDKNTQAKADACQACWEEVRMRLECDWDGKIVTPPVKADPVSCPISSSDPNFNYNGRIALYLNILGDKDAPTLTTDYCGTFNLAHQADLDAKARDGDKPLRPWLHVNVLKSLDDMLNASNVYLFAREFLRSK